MKRSVTIAFTVTALCILSIQATLVCAYQSGYEITFYLGAADATVDGKWTSSTEWTDAMTAPNLPSSILFREKWTYPSDIIGYFLVEFFTDNTNDTGDFFQYCLDPAANGGAAPQSDDVLFNYTGHTRSGLKLYKGNGTGWVLWNGWTYGTDVTIADSRTGSQMNASSHWIVELMMDRSKPDFDTSGAGYTPWIRVAVYDASRPSAGVQSWPPSSQNVPNNWGLESGQYAAIPESSTVLSIVMLSSAAVAVCFFFLRKKPKASAAKIHLLR